MPRSFTNDAQDAIEAGDIESALFIELMTEPEALYCWNGIRAVTIGGQDYEPLGDRVRVEGDVVAQLGLVAEPIRIVFDAGAILDNTDFAGRLADSTWHQRRVTVREALFTPGSTYMDFIGWGFTWQGRMDVSPTINQPGAESVRELNCEGGTFRYRGRNLHTRTNENQKRLSAGDLFFERTPIAPKEVLPWWKRRTAIPGIGGGGATGRGGGYSGGRSVLK